MDLLKLLLAKYGSHEKLAKASGKSRQTISYNNQSSDIIQRNSFGFNLMLCIGDDFNDTITSDGKNITIKISDQ